SGDESSEGSVPQLGHCLCRAASLRAASSRGVVGQDRRRGCAPPSRVLLPTTRCAASVTAGGAEGSVGGEPKTWRDEIAAGDSYHRSGSSRAVDRADTDSASVPHQAATVDLQRSGGEDARQCAIPLGGRRFATFQEAPASAWAQSKSQS